MGNIPFADIDLAAEGRRMHRSMAELFPVCRSLTGPGVRETLDILARDLPIERHSVPSGTPCFDWTVPPEWEIREAWIRSPDGKTVVDFKDNNLHVVGYSRPVRGTFPLESLLPHLHSIPEHPDLVPYRTSYYADNWGFCLSHRNLKALQPGTYDVCIDSALSPGQLDWGEMVLPGERDSEIVFSTYLCHPSMCNDNLSGIVVTAALMAILAREPRRHTYRAVFHPETIGALAWLARNESMLDRIVGGLTINSVGDPGAYTFKKSRRGDTLIDRTAMFVLRMRDEPSRVIDFSPAGSDERQFCSPGFDLPFGSLMRSPDDTFGDDFDVYHTSGDDLEFVRPEALAGSLARLLEIIHVIEHDETYVNLAPKGEPQLGRRGLYSGVGGFQSGYKHSRIAMMWTLNLSDGNHSLLDIAERASLPFREIHAAAETLVSAKLLALRENVTEPIPTTAGG